jgi:hypothetical protein
MILAAIAPAFVAKGLMPVKTMASMMQPKPFPGFIDWAKAAPNYQPDLSGRAIQMLQEIQDFHRGYSDMLFVIHPDMKADIERKINDHITYGLSIDARYLACVKWLDKNTIESHYAPLESGLLVDKRRFWDNFATFPNENKGDKNG